MVTVQNISFQLPVFIRSLFFWMCMKWLTAYLRNTWFQKKKVILRNNIFSFFGGGEGGRGGNSKCHVGLKLNKFIGQKCRSLSFGMPDSIRNANSHTLWSFWGQAILDFLFFSSKGQLLYCITIQTKPYRCVFLSQQHC